jgi:maltose O-acetyltransferase
MIDLAEIRIEKAKETDDEVLTGIAFDAKRHWNYPDHFYKIWKSELTVTREYLVRHIVYNALYLESVLGFYSIVENKSDFYSGETFVARGFWLEHLFIKPDYHRCGIGRLLVQHSIRISQERGIKELLIFADPFAKGFYDKIGAEYLHDSKSSIPDRMIPVYKLNCLGS